jgi:hypothetical protein
MRTWEERSMNRGVIASTIVTALLAGAALGGCEKGPMQKAGEKIDRVTDQDKVIGKGPVEKAGKKIDEAVDDLKR